MKLKKVAVLMVLALVVIAVPGCRKKKQPTPYVVPTTTSTEVAAPDIPTVVTQPESDFVEEREGTVTIEELPADTVELNRRAQDLGWVRDVYFEYDSSQISADGQDALAVTASWLKTHPEYSMLIEGHTDERGTQQYNLALGDRRANIAREYLNTLGVSDARLRTVSYGEERPFAQGSGEQAWRQNRRAHLVLVRQ